MYKSHLGSFPKQKFVGKLEYGNTCRISTYRKVLTN